MIGIFVGVNQLKKISNVNQANIENPALYGALDSVSGVNTVDSASSDTSLVNSTIESSSNNTSSTTPTTFHRKAPRVIDDEDEGEYEDD